MFIDDFLQGLRQTGLVIRKKTATGAAGAATCNGFAGSVTTEARTDAAGAEATYTITNNKVKSDSIVLVSIANGTNTTDAVLQGAVTPATGSFTVKLSNAHAASALNGTLVINFVVH